jgi:hypothetical protein
MKSSTFFAFVSLLFLSSCAYHLRKGLVKEDTPVVAQVPAAYLPNGWSGLVSDSYSGALAVIGDSLFFDCSGKGSRPGMQKIGYFAIALKNIVAIDATENAAMGKKILKVFTSSGSYFFVAKNPDPFCDKLRPLTQAK